jgi:hypothetical protein
MDIHPVQSCDQSIGSNEHGSTVMNLVRFIRLLKHCKNGIVVCEVDMVGVGHRGLRNATFQ